jgi:general stress protein 26
MEKSNTEKEKIILDFLQEHGEKYFTCALATCWENQPRNTPVDARNDGLNMYFSADQGGKLENIRKNPNVCLAVFIPLGKGDMKNARGLQMWGKAQIITMEENPEEFEKGFRIIKLDEIFMLSKNMPFPEEAKPKITMVKIVPHRIYYYDATGEKPGKYIWETEN